MTPFRPLTAAKLSVFRFDAGLAVRYAPAVPQRRAACEPGCEPSRIESSLSGHCELGMASRQTTSLKKFNSAPREPTDLLVAGDEDRSHPRCRQYQRACSMRRGQHNRGSDVERERRKRPLRERLYRVSMPILHRPVSSILIRAAHAAREPSNQAF
jgi:hypothetical protein